MKFIVTHSWIRNIIVAHLYLQEGGARRSWEKAWFHTDDAWRMKTDFVDEVVVSV